LSTRFRDFEHVVRIAALFAAGIAVFLLWRWWMVPADFGVHGHFRAGALADNMQRPVVHAGRAACLDCHSDVAETWLAGRHERVGCESCHGPLGRHARGEVDAPPRRPDGRTACVQCHAARAGMPKAFPRIVVSDHAGEATCISCHPAHSPGL
jgi:hypothetical protein